MSKLGSPFYARPAEVVARDLLGKILTRVAAGTIVQGRIVETEAYTGESDPGSHAFRGATPRNRVMFGPPGHVYVYISYGMHFCMNVVTDEPGVAGAVLLRALEPLSGIDTMEANRGRHRHIDLCNGPGKLCQAFGITLEQNGADLVDSELWIDDDGMIPEHVATSTRVGLSAGCDLALRFFLPDSPYVSRGKPG